jgi:hypothetical protein
MSEREEGEVRFYGKYRGTVLNNIDPEQRGRLQVQVPDVLVMLPSTWAEACVGLSGPTGPAMGTYLVPPIGTAVWVEFERGDPNRPIWSGCRFPSSSDVPSMAKAGLPVSPNIVVQTLGQHLLMVSDMPPTPATGGIVLKSSTGSMIVVNDSGIYIDNGKGASITLVGLTVTINNGALTIM